MSGAKRKLYREQALESICFSIRFSCVESLEVTKLFTFFIHHSLGVGGSLFTLNDTKYEIRSTKSEVGNPVSGVVDNMSVRVIFDERSEEKIVSRTGLEINKLLDTNFDHIRSQNSLEVTMCFFKFRLLSV